MIDRGFEYHIPPFMIRSDVVTGVMSFAEMENMIRARILVSILNQLRCEE